MARVRKRKGVFGLEDSEAKAPRNNRKDKNGNPGPQEAEAKLKAGDKKKLGKSLNRLTPNGFNLMTFAPKPKPMAQ